MHGRLTLRLLTATVLLVGVLAQAPPASAAFPGVNGKIAFVGTRDGDNEIFTINPDGSAQTQLTFNTASDELPSWSPDGTKIAFASTRDGDPDNPDIYVMNADGSNQVNLTQNAAFDNHPTWSPDGTKIAFFSNRAGGNFDIWSMNADGTFPTRLTTSGAIQEQPAWSPSGTKIAYREPGDLFTMNPDGTGQALFPLNIGPEIAAPKWSPDAQKIAFTCFVPGNPQQVCVVNADGTGGVTQLTTLGDNGSPAFAPDGTKIAFHSHRDGNQEIYVMNADGTAQTNLTQNPASETAPDWQPAPDATAPVVTGMPDRPANSNGWYDADVAIDWSSVDPEPSSGTPTDPPNTVASTEGANIVYTSDPSCDPANNCATGSLTLSIDKTNPTISGTRAPLANVNGWNKTAVTVTFDCADALSGVASCTSPVTLSNEGAGQSATGTAVDLADNSAQATVGGINIDLTDPTVTCNGAPSFILNQPGATVSATVTDSLSGPETATVSAQVSTSMVGTFSVQLAGSDLAGRSTTHACAFTVAYNFSGFVAPVDNPPTVNVAKAGQTIPVQWRVTDYNGVGIADPTSFVSLTSGSTTCSSSDPTDTVETYAGSSGLQYLGDGNWQFNWKTPKTYAGQCRVMSLNLADGVTGRTASFQFK